MSTVVEEPLPQDYVPFGQVVGAVINAEGDQTSDGDPYPDKVPFVMTDAVTFTPNASNRVVTSTNPSTYVRQKPIVCDLDSNGQLSRKGQNGVWLYIGIWHVTFSAAVGIQAFDIEIKEEHASTPLDLFAEAPYVYPPPTVVKLILISDSVNDGDVLIKEGDHAYGVSQYAFKGDPGANGIAYPSSDAGNVAVLGTDGGVYVSSTAFTNGATTLDELNDVNTTGVVTGDVLKFDGSGWVPATDDVGAKTLDELSDVNTTGAAAGEILKFDGSAWTPSPDSGGATVLDGLNDVSVAGASAGNTLTFNGTEWTATPAPTGQQLVRHSFNAPYSYVGNAPVGSSESALVWVITRINTGLNPPTKTVKTGQSWTARESEF